MMTENYNSLKTRRPLSPHLSIYRKQISSVLSIFHRFSGMILFAAFSCIAWWIILLIHYSFPDCLINVVKLKIVKLGFFVTSLAGFYHLANGIRHLIWDMGKMFSIKEINRSGWFVVISSVTFTIIFWWMIT